MFKKIFILLTLLAIINEAVSNFYELVLPGRKEVCLGDYYPEEEMVSYLYSAVYSYIPPDKDAIEYNRNISISSYVSAEDGHVYSTLKKQRKWKVFRVKQSGYIQFCFLNRMENQIIFRVDIDHGTRSRNVKSLVKTEDTFDLIEKLDMIDAKLNNSIHLYEQMEKYEEEHVSQSKSVAGFVVVFSQVSLMIILLSGCSMVLILKKTVEDKKRL